MSKRGDLLLLKDINEACHRIISYVDAIDYTVFMKNTVIQDAVIRNLEIIGEAAKSVSPGLKRKYPDISWKEMAGVRDKLIHDYFGVNLDIVWNIIKNEIGVVYAKIETLLRDEFGER